MSGPAPRWGGLARPLLVALVLATAVGLFFGIRAVLFEKVETTEVLPLEGEAARNPYFALRELLRAMRLPASDQVGLRRLPPTDHVLFLFADERHSDRAALLEWVERGGHLVYAAPSWQGDPVLAQLGVHHFGPEQADDDDRQATSFYASDRPDWPKLWADEDTVILAADGPPDAAWILDVEHGAGVVSVVADGGFLRNDALADQDHPLIAWQLASGYGKVAAAWIVARDPPPSLWLLMTRRAWPLACALSALAVAGLWMTARRFGPIAETPPREQRQLAEHVQASGRYLWGQGCQETLLRAVRTALERRLSSGSGRRTTEELARRSAAGAGLDEDKVAAAFRPLPGRDRFRFTHHVQVLETLRRAR